MNIGNTRDFSDHNGWKQHWMTKRDGKGGWTMLPAQCRFVHYKYELTERMYQLLDKPMEEQSRILNLPVKYLERHINTKANYNQRNFRSFCPFGIAQMENGELILAGIIDQSGKREKTVVAFSSDEGETWSPLRSVERSMYGRPMALTYLGMGELMFSAEAGTGGGKPIRFFSKDYGRTWRESHPLPVSKIGKSINTEGNFLVDRDENGKAVRIAGFGWMGPADYWDRYPECAAIGGFYWSEDGGRTWGEEICPKEWMWEETFEGRTYERGVSEGSLTRAANGWIIAALRTDTEARFMHLRNDNNEGTGISISKDDGKTWTPVRVLFPGGKMHANLLTMRDGTIVMTYICRQDMSGGRLVSYTRGCGAIISRDNGLTWDTEHEYMLDRFELTDGTPYSVPCGHVCSTLLPDDSIITTYGHYPSKGGCLIRWKPQ